MGIKREGCKSKQYVNSPVLPGLKNGCARILSAAWVAIGHPFSFIAKLGRGRFYVLIWLHTLMKIPSDAAAAPCQYC